MLPNGDARVSRESSEKVMGESTQVVERARPSVNPYKEFIDDLPRKPKGLIDGLTRFFTPSNSRKSRVAVNTRYSFVRPRKPVSTPRQIVPPSPHRTPAIFHKYTPPGKKKQVSGLFDGLSHLYDTTPAAGLHLDMRKRPHASVKAEKRKRLLNLETVSDSDSQDAASITTMDQKSHVTSPRSTTSSQFDFPKTSFKLLTDSVRPLPVPVTARKEERAPVFLSSERRVRGQVQPDMPRACFATTTPRSPLSPQTVRKRGKMTDRCCWNMLGPVDLCL